MHQLLSALFIILLNPLKADVRGFKKRGNDIYIVADHCSEIDKQVEHLKQWTSLTEKASCSHRQIKGKWLFKKCEANVTQCLPKHVQKYHNKNPQVHGPNCWNLSFVMSGLLPHLRYSTPEELEVFMRPPFCKQLDTDQTPQAGDIGVIVNRKKDDKQLHGFIYISPEITYSKNGYAKTNPFALQTLRSVYKLYRVKKNNPKKEVEYYRCISMDEQFTQTKNESNEAKHLTKHLEQVECLTSQMAMRKKSPLTQNAIESIAHNLKILNQYIDQSPDQQDNILLLTTKVRLHAISEQLDIIQRTYLYREHKGSINTLIELINEIEPISQ